MRNKMSAAMVLLSAVFAGAAHAQFPIPSMISYQGVLEDNGTPLTGTANLRFGLFSTVTGGTAIVTRTVANVTVTGGVFATEVDFGLPAFANAQNLFIEIEVQSPAGTGAYTLLTPRRRLGAVAYAMNTRGLRVDGFNRLTLGDVAVSAAAQVATLSLAQTGNDPRLISLQNQFGTERWAWRLPTANLELVSASGSQYTFDFATGSIAIGESAVVNPSSFSRVLSLTGRTGVPFAGSTGVVMKNPATGSIWSVGVDGAGAFSFFHNGVGGQSVVSVPVLQITGGSDIAEPYDVAPAGAGEGQVKPIPGMVVSIDAARIGKLRVADAEYDRAVAGIISGANGVATGMTLTQAGTAAHGEMPIAKVGRVWVFADADANGPIVAGDMLTTSNTAGHAMRADANRAAGSGLGKAMSPLKEGKGMVLVLVGLQ